LWHNLPLFRVHSNTSHAKPCKGFFPGRLLPALYTNFVFPPLFEFCQLLSALFAFHVTSPFRVSSGLLPDILARREPFACFPCSLSECAFRNQPPNSSSVAVADIVCIFLHFLRLDSLHTKCQCRFSVFRSLAAESMSLSLLYPFSRSFCSPRNSFTHLPQTQLNLVAFLWF
ncbi:hypothetical protein LCGC14_2564460, partial [marine sediment metagenome]